MSRRTMRVAVAGTGGLARLIAHFIREETSHQLIILSRTDNPTLVNEGYQVHTVDYNQSYMLQHTLLGVDTIISTVTGTAQLLLIHAAVAARVARFAPAEFEGPVSLRLDNTQYPQFVATKTAAQDLLQVYSNCIESTSFTCGIFYERFAPGGLGYNGMGFSMGISQEGDYLFDCRKMTATILQNEYSPNPVAISMISARDAARFIVRALDLPQWDTEMSMIGERMTIEQLLQIVETIRGMPFRKTVKNIAQLSYEIHCAGDMAVAWRAHAHLTTALGLHNYIQRNLNDTFSDIRPENFQIWFHRVWSTAN